MKIACLNSNLKSERIRKQFFIGKWEGTSGRILSLYFKVKQRSIKQKTIFKLSVKSFSKALVLGMECEVS